MTRLLSLLCLLALAAGCKPQGTSTTSPTAGAGASKSSTAAPEKKPFGIGDAEAAIMADVRVAPESLALPGLKEDPLVNAKDVTNMNTVNLQPPYPPELWLLVNIRINAGFTERPVALRGRIMRDNQPISYFSTLLGAKSHLPAEQTWPRVFKVDALASLQEKPASMLITTELTLLLLPAGTDETTVDPATAEVPEEDMSVLIINPVRINLEAASAADATAAPTPAPTADTAAPAAAEQAPAAAEPAPAPAPAPTDAPAAQ
jgi:hypothetical protein